MISTSLFSIPKFQVSPHQFIAGRSFGNRNFAVITPLENLERYDPAKKKITSFDVFNSKYVASLPVDEQWNPPNPLRIKTIIAKDNSQSNIHYFCGGIPALMQAARKVEKLAQEKSTEKVLYVNDGHTPKSLQSGHQAHVHPSEWAAEDCSSFNLLKTMLRGLGILPEIDPTDLKHYSYLHFPFSFEKLLKNPIENLSLYARFFKQRLVHNLTSTHGVSESDRWLCRCVDESLQYHRQLSERISKQQGAPSFTQCGRVYWSQNLEAMKKKEKTWKELGIDCAFIDPEQIRKNTLLKENSGLHVLKIFKDGKFYPETMPRIIRYLEQNFPNNFTSYHAHVLELHVDKMHSYPQHVEERTLDGVVRKVAVKTFFGSLGHNQVFRENDAGQIAKPLWQEVPVSGNSTLWKCTIDKTEFRRRFSDENLNSKEEFVDYVQRLLPSANLTNLHVTTWDAEITDSKVIFYLRASQGANFNSLVASKEDLRNLWENLDQFFIGDWELLSAGTCSRKTDVSNVPEYKELSRYITFAHGHSGLGFSFSGVSLKTLKQKPKSFS